MSYGNGMKVSGYERPVNLLEIAQRGNRPAEANKASGSFKDVLAGQLAGGGEITFSKHAEQRLYSRGISLTDDMKTRLGQAIDKADAKGSRETLVLADSTAFVVAVKNRTVVTVFDKENLREGVVTSIDSAVIL
jgi:flagellar operon protein